MKIIAQLVFRSALLALLALGFSSLAMRGQAVVEDMNLDSVRLEAVTLVAETPLPVTSQEESTAANFYAKYSLHVSDRARRDHPESAVRAPNVLPDLSEKALVNKEKKFSNLVGARSFK